MTSYRVTRTTGSPPRSSWGLRTIDFGAKIFSGGPRLKHPTEIQSVIEAPMLKLRGSLKNAPSARRGSENVATKVAFPIN